MLDGKMRVVFLLKMESEKLSGATPSLNLNLGEKAHYIADGKSAPPQGIADRMEKTLLPKAPHSSAKNQDR